MKYILHKLSIPGNEWEFDSKSAAGELLYTRICLECIEDVWHSKNIFDLLGTPCGCEYCLEEEDD